MVYANHLLLIFSLPRFSLFCLMCFAVVQLHAQDIHFSMFYASPLTLNPAMTGTGDGDYRVAGIYRDQWRSVTAPFQTAAASFDMPIPIKALKKDRLGVGGQFVFDKAGRSAYQTLMGNVMVSYHKSLGANARHYLGVGVSVGYQQERFNPNGLIFPSMHLGDDFDPSSPSGEGNLNTTTGGMDMSTGVLYQSRPVDRLGILAGVTVHHVLLPKRSFLGNNYRINPRWVGHLGVRVALGKGFSVVPGFLAQFQNKAKEFNLGTAVEYSSKFGKTDWLLSVGGWYRIQDAAIITAGFEVYSIRVMAAYDINHSMLRPATQGRGAFEVAVQFQGLIPRKTNRYPVMVPCPMM